VFLDGGVVYKERPDESAAEFEAAYLSSLKQKGVAVPEVLSIEGRVLRMEYVDGVPLPDYLDEKDSVFSCDRTAEFISDWFESFYTAVSHSESKEIRGDVNGRNFIVTAVGVTGVDFEARVFGKRETDLGGLLAFVASYSYEDDGAQRALERELLKSFMKRFSLGEDELLEEKTKELRAMALRRK